MRILVALGGNALLRRDQPAGAEAQQENVEIAARDLAAIAAAHELVVTHGNGPQVGLLALQNAAYAAVDPYPLDVLGAESEGMVGYMLGVALRNEMPERDIVTLLTEVVVDPDDPAFARPTKPIGPVYTREEADLLASERGWTVAGDGHGCRRVVPSPEPSAIAELRTLRLLVDSGTLVICAGGGGIPVTLSPAGTMKGIEAVVDKDLTSSLLARRLDADLLLMLTDVDAVQLDWGTDRARPLHQTSPAELREHSFPAGSMGPKVEAACRFVEATDGRAAIGQLKDAVAIVRGEAGTQVSARPA
ncbi:MAG TPA: carbamate kinase [Solirubrobacterales bacterium]|jgi:carbamate kinase|nr:carbamate kinase [Solirubrobacterales bacterium]